MQIGKRFAKAAIGACCLGAFVAGPGARAQDVPAYRVDPYWPKPLPNKWIMQQVPTLTVDKDDHIWVLNRSRQCRMRPAHRQRRRAPIVAWRARRCWSSIPREI